MILLVSIQAAALSIFMFEWVSPHSFNMKKYPPPGHKFSLCRSYWLVWATLFSASVSTDVPRSNVSRIMSLVWAAFGLTFMAVYTANLAAFMITRVQYYNLEGIGDPKVVLLRLKYLDSSFRSRKLLTKLRRSVMERWKEVIPTKR